MIRKKRTTSSRRKNISRMSRKKKRIQFMTLACGDKRAVSVTIPSDGKDVFDSVCEKAMNILTLTEDAEINHGLSVILEIAGSGSSDSHSTSEYN